MKFMVMRTHDCAIVGPKERRGENPACMCPRTESFTDGMRMSSLRAAGGVEKGMRREKVRTWWLSILMIVNITVRNATTTSL
jgi:hypothetical protein